MNTTASNRVRRSAGRISARRLLGWATMLVLLFSLVPTLAAAGDDTDSGDFEIAIPVSTVVRGPEGSEIILARIPTPTDLVGLTCEIIAMSANQSSVHPGNDLMVSGILIPDVEGEAGGEVTASDVVVLGPEILISLLMGPDGVFSAGLTVGFDCIFISGETTTTAAQTTTTMTGSTTSTLASSTTVAVPATDATTTSLETEVEDSEILPFTGSGYGQYGLFALALATGGLLVLLAARSFQGDPLPVTTLSMRVTCPHCESKAVFRTPHGILCRTHTRHALDVDRELWVPKPFYEDDI